MIKRILILPLLMVLAMAAQAQRYVGTMTIGNYTQQKVTVDLSARTGGKAAIVMYGVKFSKMMPVKLDVAIEPVAKGENGTLRADEVVPTAKQKPYEKFTVRQLRGTAADKLTFDCQMGKKQLHFSAVKASK